MKLHPLAWASEQAEDFGGFVAGIAEPVGNAGVELDGLARSEHDVLLPDDQPHPSAQDVHPLVTLVHSWPGPSRVDRKDDLPGLYADWSLRQRHDSAAVDATSLQADARVADIGGVDEVVERDAIHLRERKEQLERGTTLPCFEPGQRAL